MITFFACIIILFIVGRIFIVPLKKILKLAINSVLGGVLIYVINIVGATFGFHIGLNIGTSIFVGILGIPGAVFLIILKLMI
ncbi:MAG: pro-sigmaK processing inhibitor BofA family protein [Clostridia bacterium]|nr:pro-sigmaK processing inhibitor BofA family protein [Clostridia bacterium]